MKYRIIADSSCSVFLKEGMDDLVRIISAKEDENTETIDTKWKNACAEADTVFCVVTSSALSDSFNSAMKAKVYYQSVNPERKIYVIDTLSAGPKIALIVNKLCELIKENKSYTEIRNRIVDYTRKTHLMFSSYKNNSADFEEYEIGQTGYRGTLDLVETCRTMQVSIRRLAESMKDAGYRGGKAVVTYSQNEESSRELKKYLQEQFRNAEIMIMKNELLCSNYASGGILVGFER